MKTLLSFAMILLVALAYSGCAAKASVGNRDQHGAGVSLKTKGSDRGVHANAY